MRPGRRGSSLRQNVSLVSRPSQMELFMVTVKVSFYPSKCHFQTKNVLLYNDSQLFIPPKNPGFCEKGYELGKGEFRLQTLFMAIFSPFKPQTYIYIIANCYLALHVYYSYMYSYIIATCILSTFACHRQTVREWRELEDRKFDKIQTRGRYAKNVSAVISITAEAATTTV